LTIAVGPATNRRNRHLRHRQHGCGFGWAASGLPSGCGHCCGAAVAGDRRHCHHVGGHHCGGVAVVHHLYRQHYGCVAKEAVESCPCYVRGSTIVANAAVVLFVVAPRRRVAVSAALCASAVT